MPNTSQNYTFAGGSTGIQGYGDRWQISFGGTWQTNEKWGLIFSSTEGDFDVGSINFYSASLTLRVCSTFSNRVYIGAGPQFNFSDNGDPTGWEVQNSGAGEIDYLSNFGSLDSTYGLSQLQGRLVVLGRRSIQIWTANSDPGQFSLNQTMDNIGTQAPLSVQAIGDNNVIYLDTTGFRFLLVKETTLNAYPDDAGTPVDALVQVDLQTVSPSTCCAIVEPTTKAYWGYLNGKIYVYTEWPTSQIAAWSIFLPTYEAYTTISVSGANYVEGFVTATVVLGSTYKWTPGANELNLVNGTQTLTAVGYFVAQGTSVTINGTGMSIILAYTGLLQLVTVTTFTPIKFVVYNGIVYCRTSDNKVLAYGGLTGYTYDGSVVTVATPWMDDKTPKTTKLGQGGDVAIRGYWHISGGYDPSSTTLAALYDGVSPTGVETHDSTFDLLRIGLSQTGTHVMVRATTDATWGSIAKFSLLQIHYNLGNQQG